MLKSKKSYNELIAKNQNNQKLHYDNKDTKSLTEINVNTRVKVQDFCNK